MENNLKLPSKFYLRFTEKSGKFSYFQGFGVFHQGKFVSNIARARVWQKYTAEMLDGSPLGKMIEKGVLEVVPLKDMAWRVFMSANIFSIRYLTASGCWSVVPQDAMKFNSFEEIPKELNVEKFNSDKMSVPCFKHYAEEFEVE